MSAERARTISAQHIPVIDIGDLRAGHTQAVDNVARRMLAAAEHLGFFYVSNHGVGPSVIDAADVHARAFFRAPLEEKLKQARKEGLVASDYLGHQIEEAAKAEVVDGPEAEQLRDYLAKVEAILAVDDFAPDQIGRGSSSQASVPTTASRKKAGGRKKAAAKKASKAKSKRRKKKVASATD